MTNQTIINQLIAKTYQELNNPERSRRTQSRSRVWQSPKGYRFLVPWSNSVLLRILIRKFTSTLPRSEHRTKTQLDDAARSVVSNIEEGYKRATTSEYLQFLGYAQGSLEEIHGLVQQSLQDKFLKSISDSSLQSLGIDLQAWNLWARDPAHSLKILYFPLKSSSSSLKEAKGIYRNLEELKDMDLTYEIFVELVNKTDYLLRVLVSSLETKLQINQKYYQVEQARIKSRLKWQR